MRLIFGIFAFLAILFGLTVRTLATCRTVQLIALAALMLSLTTPSHASPSMADTLRDEFHAQASLFNFDPITKRYSHERQTCTDNVLLVIEARTWSKLAEQVGIQTYADVMALRPKIRRIYQEACLS